MNGSTNNINNINNNKMFKCNYFSNLLWNTGFLTAYNSTKVYLIEVAYCFMNNKYIFYVKSVYDVKRFIKKKKKIIKPFV